LQKADFHVSIGVGCGGKAKLEHSKPFMQENTVAIRGEDKVRLLQRENDLLNSIIQGASDAIYAKDTDGRYLTINEAGARYFGKTIEQVIGRTDMDLMSEDKVREFVARDEELFKTGKSVTYESRGTFGKGHKYFSTSKSPLRDSNGNIIGLIGVSRDVTTARLSEEKYRFIFDNAPISFWEEDFSQLKHFFDELRTEGVTDLKNHLLSNPELLEKCIDMIRVENVNRTTLDMYRVKDKESFIKRIHRNFTPESESIFLEEFVALFEGKTFFQSEGSFINLNGDTLDVQFNLSVLPGHEDDLSLVLVSIVDITDTNQLTRELNTIKHRYQSIVEAQSEMICRINSNGKIRFRNMAFSRFFSFKDPEEDTRFVTLFPPEELDRCKKKMETLTIGNTSTSCELRNYNRDGELVWQQWSVTAFFGSTGTLLGYQAVGSDITDRKMAEDALSSSEARWRSVFEHADDLIMTINSEGYILSANESNAMPRDGKWAGRTIEDVMSPKNAEVAMRLINQVFAEGKPLKTEVKMDNPDGERATFGLALSPIFHGNRVLTVVWIARNTTEIKEFEKQTREALIEGQENERMRVSQELHDGLGQLFTAIKLTIQQLKSTVGQSRSAQQQAAVAELEEYVGIAIDEVKNISRNLMPDVLWQFGLRPAIEDLVDKLRSTSNMDISVEVFGMDKRFSTETEKALFRMCQELLNNSLRHADAKHIYVQLINHGESLVLMVEDDGVGFDEREPSKGLGLRNIRSRAELLEGTVDIDSRPNRGTVTTVEIPMTEPTNPNS
jgi:PAS domain S-box-containing protein